MVLGRELAYLLSIDLQETSHTEGDSTFHVQLMVCLLTSGYKRHQPDHRHDIPSSISHHFGKYFIQSAVSNAAGGHVLPSVRRFCA